MMMMMMMMMIMMIQTQSHGVQHAHTIFTAMFVGIRTHVMNIRCKEGMSERLHRPVTVTYSIYIKTPSYHTKEST